jgi:hypothetical protein
MTETKENKSALEAFKRLTADLPIREHAVDYQVVLDALTATQEASDLVLAHCDCGGYDDVHYVKRPTAQPATEDDK